MLDRATHLVEYKEKETKTKKLVGKEATELSPDNPSTTLRSGDCFSSRSLLVYGQLVLRFLLRTVGA